MNMRVKLWGVRGSLPSPHSPEQLTDKFRALLEEYDEFRKNNSGGVDEFLRRTPDYKVGGFGGHTACVQVTTPKRDIVIDGGSGIRRYGEALLVGPCGMGKGEVHIFMTHFHWDHMIGLPFFVPIFIPGNIIHFYAVQDDLEDRVRAMFCKPHFPVPFERLGAQVLFHKLEPRQPRKMEDLTITPYQLDHPDPCWGFRCESGGKVFSHCVDTEGTRVSQKDLDKDLPLYTNADLAIYDAQYSFLEAAEKIDWGHASGPIGIDIAMREKIKEILFIHHDPAASDEKVQRAEDQTRAYYDSCVRMAKDQGIEVHEFKWCFAREGLVVEL
ncbi:MAG: MBL fold metallo-hydrolase [Bdellovibrionales bacterium]|nr:MBL fold metallo-hydrolase [Bdellovibrionales bacterium]